MRALDVRQRVHPALRNWDDVIEADAHWVRPLQRPVDTHIAEPTGPAVTLEHISRDDEFTGNSRASTQCALEPGCSLPIRRVYVDSPRLATFAPEVVVIAPSAGDRAVPLRSMGWDEKRLTLRGMWGQGVSTG